MSIDAGSPIIVLPMSSRSNQIIVADLGKLTVRNRFLFADDPQTLNSKIRPPPRIVSSMDVSIYGSLENDLRDDDELDNHICLLDVWKVLLKDMDIYEARRTEGDYFVDSIGFGNFNVERQSKLLEEKCELSLQVERNLEGDISHSVPDFCIEGSLSSVYCSLCLEQFKLVKGFLEFNLGEQLDEFKQQVMSHLTDPKNHTIISGNVWKGMSFTLHLKNVTVELGEFESDESSIAKFDFISSKVSYESHSNGIKDIDLVSNEILVSDLRYTKKPTTARPNVFTNILQPCRKNGNDITKLQMELNYRKTKSVTKFTILLNDMKLMGIFDWLFIMKDYLLSKPKNPISGMLSLH